MNPWSDIFFLHPGMLNHAIATPSDCIADVATPEDIICTQGLIDQFAADYGLQLSKEERKALGEIGCMEEYDDFVEEAKNTLIENLLTEHPELEILRSEIKLLLGSSQLNEFLTFINSGTINVPDLYLEVDTGEDIIPPNQAILTYIPNILNLQNGSTVNVTFGITNSDNKSANQQVDQLVLDGLEFALYQANLNLPTNAQIISIHISSTTNGAHCLNSNHYHGFALDISRINGKKMILTGNTIQIQELQIAFDLFSGIRENFGPHFKHKFSIEKANGNQWNLNHPIGGHKDHIHVSFR